MADQNPDKFATQMNAEILSAVRSNVMAAYLASHEKFGPLYEKLAK
jgi:hypothetical protein